LLGEMVLHLGHLSHKPSGVAFFSLVLVVMPSETRLNQLMVYGF